MTLRFNMLYSEHFQAINPVNCISKVMVWQLDG